MEQINMLKSVGKDITREKVNILLEAAVKFYGQKYENIILDVVRNTLFYEMDPNEKIHKAIENVTGVKQKAKGQMPKACQLSLGSIDGSSLDVVIWKPQNQDEDFSILSHELYGHTVCSKKSSIVQSKYKRNGLCLYDIQTEKVKLELINEGFMECIGQTIVRSTKKGIENVPSKRYSLARKSANYILKTLGKDEVLEDLVEYTGIIEKKYNGDEKKKLLTNLDFLLQREIKARNFFSKRSGILEEQVKKELIKFKQRQGKVR